MCVRGLQEGARAELGELGEVVGGIAREAAAVAGEIEAVVGEERQDQEAPALLVVVEDEAVVGDREGVVGRGEVAIDDLAHAARADRPLGGVVHAARVRACAAAEADHAVVLAAVERGPGPAARRDAGTCASRSGGSRRRGAWRDPARRARRGDRRRGRRRRATPCGRAWSAGGRRADRGRAPRGGTRAPRRARRPRSPRSGPAGRRSDRG